MHGFFSWVTLSFWFLCVETVRRFAVRVFFSLFVDFLFSFSPPLWFFLFLHVIYACLHTVSIKSPRPPPPPPLVFFFFPFPPSVTVIFTSSLDALTMQNPHSSFNHMYSFSTLAATIVCRHRGIHGNLGTKKHKPTLFGGDARLEYKEP